MHIYDVIYIISIYNIDMRYVIYIYDVHYI